MAWSGLRLGRDQGTPERGLSRRVAGHQASYAINNAMKMLSTDRGEKQGSGPRGRGAVVFFCLIVVIGSVLLTHAPACAAQLSVVWDPSGDSDVTGYKVYYGTQSGTYTEVVDAGNNTSCTIPDLVVGATYYFAVTAYDSYGYESAYSNEVASTVGGGSGGGGGGGGCFIATAAFGSYLDPHVAVLRSFRDSFLLTNRLGKTFVAWYYATSPPYADAIRQNGPLKIVVRIALFPLIGFTYLCLAAGVVPALLMAVVFLAGLAWGARRVTHAAARPDRISTPSIVCAGTSAFDAPTQKQSVDRPRDCGNPKQEDERSAGSGRD